MMGSFQLFADTFSQWTVPAVILLIILAGWWRKVPMYESFIVGAKEGFGVAISIIPYLVAILVAIKVFLASGMREDLTYVATKGLGLIGLEGYATTLELIPLAMTKPLSGGASRGILVEIFDTHGPDSFLGETASLMMGSTETTFYVLAVYFGAVGVSRFRHTVPACLIADCAGIVAALVVGYLLFG